MHQSKAEQEKYYWQVNNETPAIETTAQLDMHQRQDERNGKCADEKTPPGGLTPKLLCTLQTNNYQHDKKNK